MPRPRGNPYAFDIGDEVRYRPGVGTYGLEDGVGTDGRIGGRVIAYTAQRVRVVLCLESGTRKGATLTKAVDAASLSKVVRA